MFQYETIMDLADLKHVSFVCKNEPCGGALSIINVDAVPSSIKARMPQVPPGDSWCRRVHPSFSHPAKHGGGGGFWHSAAHWARKRGKHRLVKMTAEQRAALARKAGPRVGRANRNDFGRAR
jgi:hypothetical protein